MTVTRTKAITDSWAEQAAPSLNHGQDRYIRLNGDGSAGRRGFLHFSLPRGLTWLGGHVRTATLKLYLGSAWTGQTITVARVSSDWNEDTLTWANQPTIDSTHAVTTAAITGAAGDLVEVDITDLVNDAAVGHEIYRGLRLVASGTVGRLIYAAENPDQTLRAELELDWTLLPEGPVNLAPGGGRIIAVQNPVVSWQFSPRDFTGDTEQAYCQVQVSTTSSFTSPAFDTGQIANTAHFLDLGAAGFTGPSSGGTRYWRVRVWDDAGQVSDWSDVQSWTRQSKGTLTLTRPPSTGGGAVNDTTPAITHTFSGTQKSKEIFVYVYDGTRKKLWWHYPRTVTTDLSTSIPQKYALKTGEEYQVVLRVWDSFQRQAIPGDADYVQVVRDFFYQKAGSVTPTINLTATTEVEGPRVTLRWERATKPLWFTLVRDNKEVVDFINPDDVDQGGGVYIYQYWGATPRKNHTYEVEAVEIATVNSVAQLAHSSGNDTDTAEVNPSGVHLIDEDDGTRCRIDGDLSIDWDVRQQSTTYDIPKRRDPVQVVSGIGGYGGTLTGGELDPDGRDDFETLRGRVPKDMRLVVSDYSIVVQLETGAPAPTPIPNDQLFTCDFGFYQVDDYTFQVEGIT